MPRVNRPRQKALEDILKEFAEETQPLEDKEHLLLLTDRRTNACFCECHVKASLLVQMGTTDVPLDPDEQGEYRANREIVGDHEAYQKMKDDARKGRTFSNIVAEYTKEFDADHPVKIIGGQHRFEAIKEALEDEDIDEYHGLKVYIKLNPEQRLDVQLISNTNIAVSADLFDRMQETVSGPELRRWCQETGFLREGQDFADNRKRGGPMTVQMARSFITNYYLGMTIDAKDFDRTRTNPVLCPRGQHDPEWDNLKTEQPQLWTDSKLREAAKEFSALILAQRRAFSHRRPKPKPDYPEKALSPAILAAWAFVAGLLHGNEPRLKRHYALRNAIGKDPLNASALAKGRHKTDPENYRGLGYRSDAKGASNN